MTLLFVSFVKSQLTDKIPLPGEKAPDIELLIKWLTRDNSYVFFQFLSVTSLIVSRSHRIISFLLLVWPKNSSFPT